MVYSALNTGQSEFINLTTLSLFLFLLGYQNHTLKPTHPLHLFFLLSLLAFSFLHCLRQWWGKHGNHLSFQNAVCIVLFGVVVGCSAGVGSLYCYLRQKGHSHQWPKETPFFWLYTLPQKYPRCSFLLPFPINLFSCLAKQTLPSLLFFFSCVDVGRSDLQG